jgi:hypothetical protein
MNLKFYKTWTHCYTLGTMLHKKVSNHLSKETHSICTECSEDKTLGTCKFVTRVDAQTLSTLFLSTECFICTKCCRIRTHNTIYRAREIAERNEIIYRAREIAVRNECLSSVSLVPSVAVTEHST